MTIDLGTHIESTSMDDYYCVFFEKGDVYEH